MSSIHRGDEAVRMSNRPAVCAQHLAQCREELVLELRHLRKRDAQPQVSLHSTMQGFASADIEFERECINIYTHAYMC